MRDKFYFIAVNYNGYEYSKQYIESIQKLELTENSEVKIIIVDNKSNKDELNILESYCEKLSNVYLIKNHINLGYFGGLNEGIKKVVPTKNTIVIIGNNDLTFEKDFLLNLKLTEYDEDVLVLAPNIITRDGVHQNPHIVKSYSRLNKIKNKIYYSSYYIGKSFHFIYNNIKKIFVSDLPVKEHNHKMYIRTGIGACYILTKNFFNHFEKLDDSVFMWGEEAVFANQIESVNGKMLYDNTLIVKHYESASVKKIQSKERYKINQKSYKIYKKYL